MAAITQLTPSALPGRGYGSFAGKVGSGTHPVGVLTQLSPMGLPGRRYGSFAGKAGSGTHPVGVLTQLSPMALPGRRYGSFAGRVAPLPPVIIPLGGGDDKGRTYSRKYLQQYRGQKRKKRELDQQLWLEDEEILMMIMIMYGC